MLCAAAKSLQSCLTLCNPIDSSPPGSPIPGILQARTLEWVAISFSEAWKWKVKVKSLSRVRLCATPWTAAHQAPPSMGFSRQEYWSGLPFPSPIMLHRYCFFTGGRFVATVHWASLLVLFFQQHLLTLCFCHILVILIFQTFSLLYLLWLSVMSDLWCCYYNSVKAQVVVRTL